MRACGDQRESWRPGSRWARSITTGLGNLSGPRISGSQVWRKAAASPPSVFSGKPISCRFDLQCLFSRSSSFNVSYGTFFWRYFSLPVNAEMSSSALSMQDSAVVNLSEKTSIAYFIAWSDEATSWSCTERSAFIKRMAANMSALSCLSALAFTESRWPSARSAPC